MRVFYLLFVGVAAVTSAEATHYLLTLGTLCATPALFWGVVVAIITQLLPQLSLDFCVHTMGTLAPGPFCSENREKPFLAIKEVLCSTSDHMCKLPKSIIIVSRCWAYLVSRINV